MRAPAVSMSPRSSRSPGEVLLNPVAIAALGLLLLNDHVLKGVAPGVVTGKLSDFAGLAFFPLLLVAGWELSLAASGRWSRPSARSLSIAVTATASWFVLVKTTAPMAEATGAVIGAAQWLVSLLPHLIRGEAMPALGQTAIVVDSTDLVALMALAIPVWIGRRRVATARAGGLPASQPARLP
jgi:hypothetical protein